jgi:hypothetical protein
VLITSFGNGARFETKPFRQYTPDFMAAENDWKCERIFEDAGDGLINSLMNFSPEPGWRWLYH